MTLGIDVWDGSARQVDSIYRATGDVTYPLLLEGSRVGRQYALDRDNYVVIDHQGLVRYRTPTARLGLRFDDRGIRASIQEALEELEAEMEAEMEEMTAVLGEEALPGRFALEGNYPNPFNAGTLIRFRLPAEGRVSLRVYDAAGRPVRRLVEGYLSQGQHRLSWDGRDESGEAAASGVYLYRLEAHGQARARKMVLLR